MSWRGSPSRMFLAVLPSLLILHAEWERNFPANNGSLGHDNSVDYHRRNAGQTDQPIAALLTDLKERGLLESTLVIWAGEFGRTPMKQGGSGRNHNPYGFNIWMAGGGVKAGTSIGATDEIGLRAVEQAPPVKNLHATILTALGLAPDDLFIEHQGRQERLTGVAQNWKVIPGVLS